MVKVVVVDYGVGNLLSVTRALARVGADVVIANEARQITDAGHLVLPGVGAFGAAMAELKRRDLIDALVAHGKSGRPFLGICLGAQMMMDSSDEFGNHAGLGLISGHVTVVPSTTATGGSHRIPHIGWADLVEPTPGRWAGTIFEDTPPSTSAYFVHSFQACPDNAEDLLACVDYDGIAVTAAIGRGALVGCQFHPEKSGEKGLALLHRFMTQA